MKNNDIQRSRLKTKLFFEDEAEGYTSNALTKNLGTKFQSNKEIVMVKRAINNKKGLYLDVGVGNGRFSEIMINNGIKVVGVDISIEMLKRAKKIFDSQSPHFVLCDAHYLPFKNDIFDGLSCIRVFKYFQYQKEVMKEFKQVLKQDAQFIIQFANSTSYLKIFKVFYRGIVFKLTSFKDASKMLNENEFKVDMIKKNIRIPSFIYNKINNKPTLMVLISVEKILDFLFPNMLFVRDYTLIGTLFNKK